MNTTTPPILSTSTLLILVRYALMFLFGKLGWSFTEAQLGEIAAWTFLGLLVVANLWGARRNVKRVANEAADATVPTINQDEAQRIAAKARLELLREMALVQAGSGVVELIEKAKVVSAQPAVAVPAPSNPSTPAA